MNKLALVLASLLVLAPLSAFAQTQPDQGQASTASAAQTQPDQNHAPTASSDVTSLLVGGN